MDDSLDPFARRATQEAITAKRDRVLAERARLFDQRAEILSRIRRADRELADCRAAARLFDLDIEFPDEDERMLAQRREIEYASERDDRLRREDMRRRAAHAATVANAAQVRGQVVLHQPSLLVSTPVQPAAPTSPAPAANARKRPPIREIILRQLEQAGVAGGKAADLRDFIERTYGGIIHEKTVGMTLYRLSQDGLVRREGHTWFFGNATAETKNPGLEGPGSVDMA